MKQSCLDQSTSKCIRNALQSIVICQRFAHPHVVLAVNNLQKYVDNVEIWSEHKGYKILGFIIPACTSMWCLSATSLHSLLFEVRNRKQLCAKNRVTKRIAENSFHTCTGLHVPTRDVHLLQVKVVFAYRGKQLTCCS